MKTEKTIKYKYINKNTQYTLILTNEAKKQIKKVSCKNKNIIGLRINIKQSGCAGFSYIFNTVNNKNLKNTDLIFEYKNEIKLFVPHKIIPLINKSELDYIQDGLNCLFKFKNPNARYTCGCGESFNV